MQVHQHSGRATPHTFAVPLWSGAGVDESLGVQVLSTPYDFEQIKHLRQHAASTTEYELDPELALLDNVKDGLGVVWGIRLDGQFIATVRGIPAGHGVTLTERLWRDRVEVSQILGPVSWEVGRLVIAPLHRRADLLARLLTLVLRKSMDLVEVQNLHASCLSSMARLYRRFGCTTRAEMVSPSGKRVALIHGRIVEVAAALDVKMEHVHKTCVYRSPVNVDSYKLQEAILGSPFS